MGRQFRPARQGGADKRAGGLTQTFATVNGASSTAIRIPNYGYTDLSTYAAGDYVLDAPSEGVHKTLVWASSSSAAVVVRGSTGTTVKMGHSAATQITFGLTTTDCAAELLGLNSTRWAVVNMTISTTIGSQNLSTIASMAIGTS